MDSRCPFRARHACAKRCVTASLCAGERLRPTLVYLTGESLGAPLAQLANFVVSRAR